jgi:hypothetical protein
MTGLRVQAWQLKTFCENNFRNPEILFAPELRTRSVRILRRVEEIERAEGFVHVNDVRIRR